MSKFNVNIPDINEVLTILSTFSNSMDFNKTIIEQMIQESQDWNDNVGKKFKELMKECETSIKEVLDSCESTSKELNAVKKQIENYYNIF